MHKFLKLSAVSMLAIMTASNANAAGYTCEELIEYTSCNPGYYLSAQDDRCPEGTMYITGVCDWTISYDNVQWNMTEAECYEEENTAVYRPEACLRYDSLDEENSWAEGVDLTTPNGSSVVMSCSECPAGSYCPAGSESPTPCPAGSYCAGTKLGAVSGVCAIGSYSLAGATACSTCPASGLTDANGNVVSVTTASTGSTSSSACFVAKGTEFKDSKGTYKYTDNCTYGNSDILGDRFYESANGTCADGYQYMEAYEDGGCSGRNDDCMAISVTGCYKIPDNEEWCSEVDGRWTGDTCECDMEWFGDTEGIYNCTNT